MMSDEKKKALLGDNNKRTKNVDTISTIRILKPFQRDFRRKFQSIIRYTKEQEEIK